jgi:DNA-binding Xre family transcriptional regulator
MSKKALTEGIREAVARLIKDVGGREAVARTGLSLNTLNKIKRGAMDAIYQSSWETLSGALAGYLGEGADIPPVDDEANDGEADSGVKEEFEEECEEEEWTHEELYLLELYWGLSEMGKKEAVSALLELTMQEMENAAIDARDNEQMDNMDAIDGMDEIGNNQNKQEAGQ